MQRRPTNSAPARSRLSFTRAISSTQALFRHIPCILRISSRLARAISTRRKPKASSTSGVCRPRYRHCGSKGSCKHTQRLLLGRGELMRSARWDSTPCISKHSELYNAFPPSFASANDTSPYHAEHGKGRLCKHHSGRTYYEQTLGRPVGGGNLGAGRRI